jgi:hypothetical protein
VKCYSCGAQLRAHFTRNAQGFIVLALLAGLLAGHFYGMWAYVLFAALGCIISVLLAGRWIEVSLLSPGDSEQEKGVGRESRI